MNARHRSKSPWDAEIGVVRWPESGRCHVECFPQGTEICPIVRLQEFTKPLAILGPLAMLVYFWGVHQSFGRILAAQVPGKIQGEY